LKVFLLCPNALYFVPAPRESHLFERLHGRNPGGEIQPRRAGEGAAIHILYYDGFLVIPSNL
jgi:hypothetical protein